MSDDSYPSDAVMNVLTIPNGITEKIDVVPGNAEQRFSDVMIVA